MSKCDWCGRNMNSAYVSGGLFGPYFCSEKCKTEYYENHPKKKSGCFSTALQIIGIVVGVAILIALFGNDEESEQTQTPVKTEQVQPKTVAPPTIQDKPSKESSIGHPVPFSEEKPKVKEAPVIVENTEAIPSKPVTTAPEIVKEKPDISSNADAAESESNVLSEKERKKNEREAKKKERKAKKKHS